MFLHCCIRRFTNCLLWIRCSAAVCGLSRLFTSTTCLVEPRPFVVGTTHDHTPRHQPTLPRNTAINRPTNRPTNQPTSQPINQSTCPPINQSINQPTNQPIVSSLAVGGGRAVRANLRLALDTLLTRKGRQVKPQVGLTLVCLALYRYIYYMYIYIYI